MARRDQRLYRDPDDQVLGGVCSGLGHYFDVDTTLLRVLFAVFALFIGGGLVYLILWIVLPLAPPGHWDEVVDPTESEIEEDRAEAPAG